MEGALVETSRLSPVKQDRANLLFEKPEQVTHWSVALTLILLPPPLITILIQQHEEHLGHVVAELPLRHPGGDLPELLEVHPDPLHVQEEERTLQLRPARQHVEQVLE